MKKRPEKAPPDIGAEESAVLTWVNGVKFKKKRFGGVDETDVWRKIGELNRLYEKLLIAERSRFEAASGQPDAVPVDKDGS